MGCLRHRLLHQPDGLDPIVRYPQLSELHPFTP